MEYLDPLTDLRRINVKRYHVDVIVQCGVLYII
jgi:hypothetical protein